MAERGDEAPGAWLDALPGRVLCVDVDAAGAAGRCGGLLAWHGARGDRVACLFAVPAAEPGADRRAELCPALASPLAWSPPATEGLEEHPSPASDPLLVERLAVAIRMADAQLVYGPGAPAGADLERRALARALRAAVAGLDDVLLLEAAEDGGGDGGVLRFDLPAEIAEKKSAAGAVPASGGAEEAFRGPDEPFLAGAPAGPQATAVICTWNKSADVRANLEALRAQTRPFASVVVVDNASSDDTAVSIARDFPEVRLVVMPHSAYGACETFNIGFACADTELIAILDDDVVLPPTWVERATARLDREPDTTAIVSTKVVEPGMPDWFISHPLVNRERYMSTFRGCATLARRDVLEACGDYDEAFFIYGNERDLTGRLLRAGYRVLQYPGAVVRHGTPFGMKTGARSLYYHIRNLWWNLVKHAPAWDIVRFFVLQLRAVLPHGRGSVALDATGTIGVFRAIRGTRGGLLVLARATLAALAGLPRCLRERRVCRAADFSLPVK